MKEINIDFHHNDCGILHIYKNQKSWDKAQRTLDRFRNNYKTFTTQGMHNYKKGMDTRKKGTQKPANELGLKTKYNNG